MPPRKATKKAAKASPLDGCVVATSGKFPGLTQAALASRLTALGATVESKVTTNTTILIATEKDYESNSTKVKSATANNVPVVTLDWFEECEQTGNRAPTSDNQKLGLTCGRFESRRDAIPALICWRCSSAEPDQWVQEASCII